MMYKQYNFKKQCYEWVNKYISIQTSFESKSVADFSKWSPNLENTKQLQLALSGSGLNKKYDYDDGVDTNSPNYLLRNKSLDITERETILRGILTKNQSEAEAKLNEEVEKLSKEQLADSLKKDSDPSISSSSSSE